MEEWYEVAVESRNNTGEDKKVRNQKRNKKRIGHKQVNKSSVLTL